MQNGSGLSWSNSFAAVIALNVRTQPTRCEPPSRSTQFALLCSSIVP